MSTFSPLDLQASPAGLPLFQRVAEAVTRDIRRGRLLPGQRLPSSRDLAEMLSVHRNTVLAAYEELRAQGYLETRPARGTFVCSDLPQSERSKRAIDQEKVRSGKGQGARAKVALRLAPSAPPLRFRELPQNTLALVGGMPDLRTVPRAALARAYRSALKESPGSLDYQSEWGQPRFLRVLSRYLADNRGVVAGQDEMMTTRGSQHALYLAALALNRPGSVIAVEHAGYPPAWDGFRLAGAELRSVRVDKNGLVVSDLERLCAEQDVSAIYVTPHHQYPTTVTMNGARRMSLLALAARKNFVVIEDDYDHEFHFEGRPVLPLAHADERGVVLHVGTLSKVLAPGLRLGYAVGQSALIESMARARSIIDRQGDHVLELALAFLIEDGEIEAHIRRMHRRYEERRQVLFDALHHELGGTLRFSKPTGGLAVWARIEGGICAEKWAERGLGQGVLVQPGQRFFFDGRARSFFRLGYARQEPEELREAVKRLRSALP